MTIDILIIIFWATFVAFGIIDSSQDMRSEKLLKEILAE